MKHGFIKAAACTPKIKVADPFFNGAQIMAQMEEACKAGAKILVFPELCLTGYTCAGITAAAGEGQPAADCGMFQRTGCPDFHRTSLCP